MHMMTVTLLQAVFEVLGLQTDSNLPSQETVREIFMEGIIIDRGIVACEMWVRLRNCAFRLTLLCRLKAQQSGRGAAVQHDGSTKNKKHLTALGGT
jgi:hypothetical protein